MIKVVIMHIDGNYLVDLLSPANWCNCFLINAMYLLYPVYLVSLEVAVVMMLLMFLCQSGIWY